MQAQPKTIRDILHTGDQYIIPLFQRTYSWDKPNWERLRKDIWALTEDGAKPVHFLGPLVCTQPPRLPGSNSAFQLIDGQQRITTLTIFLAALRDVARSRGLHDLADEVTESYLLYKRKQGSERYKVLPRLVDREALIAMVEGRDLSGFVESRLFQGWKYFRRHIEHRARRDTESQLNKLLDAVSTRLCLVVVLIDAENPYEIFESLNSTGLPLKQSDLIRNYVFMQIPLADQQDFSDQHWKAFEGMFQAIDGEQEVDMTSFYRDYMMRAGRYSREDSTFIDFKALCETSRLSPHALVTDLMRLAKLAIMLRRPRTVKDGPLKDVLIQIDGMDITTAFPLFLNLFERHENGQLSADVLIGCLRDVVSFVLRRSICGETTRGYNKWFVDAIGVIRNDPRVDLQLYWLDRRWPDDETLRQRLAEFPIYRRENSKARVILEAIERSYGHRERVDLTTLSIEHVMPQTISNSADGREWKAMLGSDWNTVHEQLLHTIGNLTLTGYNASLSNAAFRKKQELLSDSHLDLNNHFAGLPVWNSTAIRARSRILADCVVRLWPRPDTTVKYDPSPEALLEPIGLSIAETRRLAYWRQFDSRIEERGMPRELVEPTSESALHIPIGGSGAAEIDVGINQSRGSLYVSLTLSNDAGAHIASKLSEMREQIERDLGYALVWDITKSGGEIYAQDVDIPLREQDDWPVQHDWLGDRLEDFQRVIVPRVLELESIALLDPEIKQSVEKRNLLAEYWNACREALRGSSLVIRQSDPSNGRKYCRFEPIDTGVYAGIQCEHRNSIIYLYMYASGKASHSCRATFKKISEDPLAEMGSEIGPILEWSDPYFSVTLTADISTRSDWARQHQWIRETGEKLVSAFKRRLGIEE